uniref:cilia- and flagella-associated protein 61 n=1 Tax=Ciona intestinalis TaxID=7719 RepID=UPI000180D116|nr:cilia- and flagella-associated protein 61 [Ciona intestinalis]|eukprot:XP_002126453.1 cilia- and flagella-associated protein 61 [Ciona intestinalis]
MTTVTSSHGPTEVINARRTESLDAPAILELIAPRTNSQFGRVNIVHLIEKSNLSVTLNNEENEVLGFAGFLDQPQIEVCNPAEWEQWMLDMKYKLSSNASPLNSLFLHYFAAKDDYTIGCASEIVRTVFNAVPELRFIFLSLRSDTKPEPALAQIFHPAERDGLGGHHTLYVCHRHNHVPLLHVRKACVEDHDDLTPIFKQLNNNLTETYGDYFLAEMIEAQDEDNHSIVAEVGGKAVGFLSVCSHVNVKLLQDCFELDSFHGLCKEHPDDILQDEAPPPPTPPPSAPTSNPEEGARISEVSIKSSSSEADNQEEKKDSVSVATNAEEIQSESEPSSSSALPPTGSKPKLSEIHMQSSSSLFQDNEENKNEEVFFRESPISPKPFVSTYKGESNAFSIQLFCIDEQYEMRSADFLPKIFKLFPDKDFAVITVPHLVPEFPLIQQFVRVTPKPMTNLPHELYVFHRNGLLSSGFNVRLAKTEDYEQVEKLTKNIKLRENLLADLKLFNSARRDTDGTEIQAFVADCIGQVVGICIVRREENVEEVRAYYNIEDFIYFNHHRRDEHSHLHHFALNPIFQHYAKHFIKEVLRQGHKSCLYYPIYPSYAPQSCSEKHSLITGLNFMVPVRARRQIEYPLQELGINAPSERVISKSPPYAINHINRKLTLEPKVTINARIVVVGASDVGISFLESLCFCPHLRFNNLTLVSKRGLPQTLLSSSESYSRDDLARLSLRSWVNIVQGFMTDIDRKRKHVITADGARVAYDHLIICTGQQYQIPCPTGADVNNMAANHDLTKGAGNKPYDMSKPIPDNVVSVNDDYDVRKLSLWATNMGLKCEIQVQDEKSPMVVVYGRSFDAYTTVQCLMSHGIPGPRIALVRPPTQNTTVSVSDDITNGDPFNEPVVSKMVQDGLETAGVRVFDDHVLADWCQEENNSGGTHITSVSFTSPTKPVIQLPCMRFISFHPKRIDERTFLALNRACLVFDGRLAIDSSFKTNDPSIRAAGPITKYARRYHAEGYWSRHENYSSKEIGFRLALTVLPLFDPTLDGSDHGEYPPITPATTVKPETPMPENPHEKLIPVYTDPKVTQGVLPGGYTYLHIRKPGDRPSYAAQLDNIDHGMEIVTGSPENGNYFRLHLNQYKKVETVTCLVKDVKLPASNLVRLYGVHERYLNNLVARLNEAMIPDLYVFFREPWCMSIFHDRFQDFRHEVRELLSSAPPGAESLPSLEAKVRQLVDEDLNISSQQRAELKMRFANNGQRKEVEARLLSYLSYNYYHLPMYAKPGMV